MSDYYARHRESITERFRRRYAADPLFREEHKRRVAANKKRRAEQRRVEKMRAPEKKKIWRVFNLNGTVVRCCRIGTLAEHIERSVQTIELWEKRGEFPRSIRYKKQRYYTEAHVAFVVSCRRKYPDNLPKFFQAVRAGWNAVQPIPVKGGEE